MNITHYHHQLEQMGDNGPHRLSLKRLPDWVPALFARIKNELATQTDKRTFLTCLVLAQAQLEGQGNSAPNPTYTPGLTGAPTYAPNPEAGYQLAQARADSRVLEFKIEQLKERLSDKKEEYEKRIANRDDLIAKLTDELEQTQTQLEENNRGDKLIGLASEFGPSLLPLLSQQGHGGGQALAGVQPNSQYHELGERLYASFELAVLEQKILPLLETLAANPSRIDRALKAVK